MTKPQLRERAREEMRAFYDKCLKPKKPTMKNLERELLVNFIDQIITLAIEEQSAKMLKELPNAFWYQNADIATKSDMEFFIKASIKQ